MKLLAPRLALVAGAFLALTLACRVAGAPQGPAALIFGATAVAATAVYREASGGCWAACNTGWACNPTTGRCEPTAREPLPRLRRPTATVPTAAAPEPPDAGTADAATTDTPLAPSRAPHH